MADPASSSAPRARLAVALGAALALAGVIVAVLALGDASEEAPAAASDCIEAWNEDGVATSYGRHNATFHKYEDVQVVRLELAGGELGESPQGECAVVFGAVELDSEPIAAGQLLRGGTWTPFSLLAGVELDRVAELQAVAIDGANVSIDEQGELAEL